MSLEAAQLPPFPLHAFPGPLGWYASEVSRATQTPLILAASVALGAASIAVAKKIQAEPRPGWVEQLVLWMLVLLASGERKTAAMNALRKPLDEWEQDRRRELGPQIAQAESQRKILTRRLREAEKEAARGEDEDATQAALELARQVSELEVPSLPQLTTSDTTQEAAAILCAQNEGKIAIWSDEGEIVKVIAGRYSKDQSPAVELFLKGYSGGYYSSSRVGRDGVCLSDPAIPQVLSIQPGVIFGLGNQRALHDQGYFARPLYGLPPSALGSRKSRPEPVDERAREAYGQLIKTLLDIEMPKDEYGEVSPYTLRFSQAADELLEDLQDWVEPQLAPSGEMSAFREWGSKFAGQVVRIAGILHLTDRVTAGDERPWETPVERLTLRRAIEIGLCYLEHGRAVMVEMGADPRIGSARHLLEVFKESNIARISTRDLFDKVRKDSRFKTMDDLSPVIELLKEHGYVRELKPKKRRGPGRPRSVVLEVNPLPPGPPPQNPQNPQNSTPRGTKPFFEWLEERRGPEDPPPSSGPGGPEPKGSSPTPEAAPPTDEASAHDYLRGGDASGVFLEEPNPNGHYPSPEAKHEVERSYELVSKQAQLTAIISEVEAAQMIGLDLETTGLCWWRDRIRVLSISTEAGKTYLIDAFEIDIRPLFKALKGTKIVAHNALFDALFLRRAGFEAGEYACTMVLSQILWAGKLKPHSEKNVEHDLASVAKRALGEHLDKGKQKADWSGELTPEMLEYAAKDSKVLIPLYQELMHRIEEAGDMDWVLDIEMRLLKAMVHISDNGLPIDHEKWAAYIRVITEEKEALVCDMDELVTQPLPEDFLERNKKKGDRAHKINWQSNEQAAWVLQECHRISLPLTKKGNPSIGKDALKQLEHPLAHLLARFNQIKNTSAIFGKALEERHVNGRLYAEWKQCEADTGRMSCANPPLQGIPSEGKLRKAVVAPEGYKLVVSDLSQIEVRILAALSEDETLIGAFGVGADIHRSVAATVLGKKEKDVTNEERKITKRIIFGQMYGQGVSGLRSVIQNDLGREFSQAEAQEYWDKFFDAYPGVKRWREKESRAFDIGYRYTRTLKGRQRLDVGTKTKRWNTPIQGLAADALKAIAVSVYERQKEIAGLEMVGLVHDEVLLLVPEEHAERTAVWLSEIMKSVAAEVVNGDAPSERRVPIEADKKVCISWGDKK